MLASRVPLRDPAAMTTPHRAPLGARAALALACAVLLGCGGDGSTAAEVASLRAELERRDDAARDLERRLTALEDDLELVRSTTATSLATHQGELDDVAAATEDLAGELDDLSASLEELSVALGSVRVDLESAATDRAAVEAALEGTLGALGDELDATRAALDAARAVAEDARADAEAVRGSVVVLGDRVDAVRDRVDRLESARSTPTSAPR